MWEILVVAGTLVCAIQAIRAKRLLYSALWLAGTSALVALLMYMLGAAEVAVVELSVGAGLVTVLFVFAINIAGEEALTAQALLPKPLAWVLVVAAVVLLGWMTLSRLPAVLPENVVGRFAVTVWEDRNLDVLLQIVLIFAGVLGVIGLLSEDKTPHKEKHS